jgi:uncharacterized repeat protein (TIGR01451 family)
VAVSIFLAVLGSPQSVAAVDFAPAKSYAVGTSPAAIAVGDFNGDGKLDIAVANTGSNDVSILLGNGDGTFQPAMNFSAGNSPSKIAVGDFNGDGKLDLAVLQPGANGVAGSVGILIGNGNGTFQAPKTLALSATASFMAIADFNGDKKSDLAIGDSTSLEVFIGNGDGTFQAAKQTVLSSNGVGIVTADFNGDSKPDAAVVTGSGIQILLGNGDGTFSQGVLLTAHGILIDYVSAVAADLNHDGKVDLLVNTSVFKTCCSGLQHDTLTTSIDAFFGNGDGSFQSGQVVASEIEVVFGSKPVSGGEIYCPFVGDFNGDGKIDLASQERLFSQTSLGFLLGKGDGSFSLSVSGVGLPGPVASIAQDLNADHLDDLIFVGTANNINVQLNITPTSGADLGILSSTVSPLPAGVGANVTFTAHVLNLGPQDATGVSLTDTLPNNVNFLSATATQGSCVQSKGIVACSIGSLTSASDSQVSIVVSPTVAGTITNSMSVTASEPDPIPGNNNVTQTGTVVAMLTLTVTKAGNGSGTVTDNGMNGLINCGNICSASYPQGTSVSLSATPAGTSVFAGWSGACTSRDPNNCSINMNSIETVTATFSPSPDFTMTPAFTALTTQTGKQITDALTLTGKNGFSGQVDVSCAVTGPVPMATCGVSPSSVTLGSSPINSTLTITAPTSLVAFAVPVDGGDRITAFAAVLPVPTLLLGGIGLAFRRLRKRPIGIWLMGSLVVLLVVIAGCGGGGTPPPTPKTYTVTVNATSSSGSLQQSATVTVTVN